MLSLLRRAAPGAAHALVDECIVGNLGVSGQVFQLFRVLSVPPSNYPLHSAAPGGRTPSPAPHLELMPL